MSEESVGTFPPFQTRNATEIPRYCARRHVARPSTRYSCVTISRQVLQSHVVQGTKINRRTKQGLTLNGHLAGNMFALFWSGNWRHKSAVGAPPTALRNVPSNVRNRVVQHKSTQTST